MEKNKIQPKNKTIRAIGIMSGTSLDGLDIADCFFTPKKDKWEFELRRCVTIPYSRKWTALLRNAHQLDGYSLALLNTQYGHFIGERVNFFIGKDRKNISLIASHGHTVFHQPKKRLTVQIGEGAAIAAECGLQVVSDFRTLDVAFGGQGAPLVPMGDKHLFSEYDFCLNLGGIANISFERGDNRIAGDICPTNLLLNFLALQLGKEFDRNGSTARCGNLNQKLLSKLNSLKFYRTLFPKSLGREWVETHVIKLIEKSRINTEDKLRTVTEHIALQISGVLMKQKQKRQEYKSRVLVTGGGAFNNFLVELIRNYSECEIIIPETKLIKFKEALIFAFLGVLRMEEKVNCDKSVTGARRNSSGGTIYLGQSITI